MDVFVYILNLPSLHCLNLNCKENSALNICLQFSFALLLLDYAVARKLYPLSHLEYGGSVT
jgi:hypothetical protein